jgi:hypothetical protein
MHRPSRLMPRHAIAVALAAAGLGLSFGIAPAAATTKSAPAPTPKSTATDCAVTWGSAPKTVYSPSPYWVTDARAGRHQCYDRFVVDVADSTAGYDVKYVAQVYATDYGVAPGTVAVPLRGGAKLQVVVGNPAYGPDGYTFRNRNAQELVNVSGYRTFRQVAYAGTRRAETTFGLGVRARLPFRAFVLPGEHARVVVDIAHQW